jgi:hypothetical protein
MRSTFRRVGEAAVILATVGSFLIGLREAVYFTGQIPSDVRPALGMPVCNWAPYVGRLGRLRGIPKAHRPSGWEKLGEDTHFAYYYNHETGQAICDWLKVRPPARVEASRTTAPTERGQAVILVCVLVIVAGGTCLKIIHMIRGRRKGK